MSYEEEVKNEQEKPKKLSISMLEFFWRANPITQEGKGIPGLLRQVEFLKDLSMAESRRISQWMHLRHFSDREVIFRQGQIGIGCYIIYSGKVDIVFKRDDGREEKVILLEKRGHFGEMALVEKNFLRNVTAIAHGNCSLLGIFQPDMDELMGVDPVLSAKIFQAIASMLSKRLNMIRDRFDSEYAATKENI